MSHVAIAAVLRLDAVSASERLTAFSLASFANREHRAWPGTHLAAARAGLSHSQYLAARDGLARRDLVRIEEAGGGRGHSPVIALDFAQRGPWFEGSVNAELVELALSHSRMQGSARVLLATLAAVADDTFTVSRFATDELRASAGIADSTYRRARAALLGSDELVLEAAGGGRSHTNQWIIRDPRSVNPEPVAAAPRRSAPPRSARPLIAATRRLAPSSEQQLSLPAATGQQTTPDQMDAPADGRNPGQDRTVSERKGPGLTGVSPLKGPELSGVSDPNPGQNRTVSPAKGPGLTGVSPRNPGQDRTHSAQTPPQTPPETPPPNARAGREPQNPRTQKDPPNPPEGGSPTGQISIVEEYLTDRGPTRHRTITVDLNDARSQLHSPSPTDRGDWEQIHLELRATVGGSAFDIWLSPVELTGRHRDGTLLLGCPVETRQWISGRYGPPLDRAARSAGRRARLATDRELQLLHALSAVDRHPVSADSFRHDHQEAV